MARTSRVNSLIRQMADAYDRQRLVPFLGAGMSVPACRTWKPFVKALEERAGTATAPTGVEGVDLAERANRALSALRRREAADLRDALLGALLAGTRPVPTPRQTQALAELDWPLVITTNYDDLYVAAKMAKSSVLGRSEITVLGRTALDCQRVLTSLQEPGEPLLWALHGFLGGIADEAAPPYCSKPTDLVVGHEEYRRVIHTENHFRRAFAEVLRTRSLLFLGCGLDDPHLVGLFEETLALTGRPPFPHYAVLFKGRGSASDHSSLRYRLALTPVVLSSFDELPGFLESLTDRVKEARPQVDRWSVTFPKTRKASANGHQVEIVRGRLPDTPPGGSCLLVGAGREEHPVRGVRPRFSASILALLKRKKIDVDEIPGMQLGEAALVDGHDVIVAFARCSDRGAAGRDARLIATSTEAALELASRSGYQAVHAQLLTAGGAAPFPGRVALAQMLRAYSRWQSKAGRRPVSLHLHVVEPRVLVELSANRIDLIEMLDVETTRFWTEVAEDSAGPHRELHFLPPSRTLNELAASLYTDGGGWRAVVYPSPTNDEHSFGLPEAGDASLEDVGVLPGSTVRFIRAEGAGRSAAESEPPPG